MRLPGVLIGVILMGCKDDSPRPFVREDKLAQALRAAGLERIGGFVQERAARSIGLKSWKKSDTQIDIGRTKLGGLPDLPSDIPWPAWKNRPMSFLAQFNLAETNLGEGMPQTGMLYFFYDSEQGTWGFDPKDRGSWCVAYFDGPSEKLVRSAQPVGLSTVFDACSLEYMPHENVPHVGSSFIRDLDLNESERERYENLQIQWNNHKGHKVFGHPNPIQDADMEEACALVAQGLYLGDGSGLLDPRYEEFKKDAGNWILLLQLDSDDNAKMMWGDAGKLYFWIRREDLRHRRFDRVWMILQCY